MLTKGAASAALTWATASPDNSANRHTRHHETDSDVQYE